jgi:AraC family transcriptional regulator
MNGAVILAERELPYGFAQLVEWHWPAPIDMIVREARHMIELSLPPFAADGICAFPALDPVRFRFMGSLFVRPAGIDLHARSIGGRIRVVRLTIDPDTEGAARSLALDGERLGDGLDLRVRPPRFLLQRIRDELLCPGPNSDALVRALADAALIEIARGIDARSRLPRSDARLADWQFARVRRRIEEDGAPPEIAELAALCGISVRHFTRLFRALTGESPARAIERARMERAMMMLATSAAPVKAVAGRVGYAQDSAFSTAFRRAVGISPGAWRQRHRVPH